ncbi:predicted alpha/beta hydrolase [Moesziomyces antarcticus T-34]|uniref:Predicted alpha/beta hydrolase n=1 Tax=Pseudozyma antarctica (strain T-34) TaxID=1151754 RepID=M9M0G1_PSEA3|nr:predicted alpha/beta hydrolase [Moesziomyces antarcticus T-34]
MTAPGSSGLLRRSLYLPLGLLAVYTTFFIALLTPTLQRHFIFLHAVQFPFFPSFPQPHKYGLAPGKTRALHLDTRDGEKIGVWHVLPEIAYQSLVARDQKMEAGQFDGSVYDKAMREYPTVLYLHGNAMHRAAPWRIAAYSALTSRMDVNVVAIDYRGFGDSSGSPSEAGVVEDAHTAYKWIKQQQGRSNQRVTLFGQSLGTGIAAILATQLAEHDEVGVVLMAPYANLRSLVSDFRLGGVLPLLAPVKAIPFHESILDRCMQTRLDTLATLPRFISAPHTGRVVLLHARDDPVIPASHSHRLFRALHGAAKKPAVQSRDMPGFAHIQRFQPSSTADDATVTLIETHFGGHNQLTEGALDLVRLALRLPSHLSP